MNEKMTYKAKGKGSRAWWLQAIKWFGQDSIKGIQNGINATYPQGTRAAVADLVSESYVNASGPTGRGLTPTYTLTELGEGYLSRNQDDLEETDDAPAAPPAAAPEKAAAVFTWKRVLGGGVKYYADGQHVAAALVPEAELARIRQELGAGKFGSDVEHQAEHEYHEGDVYTWKQPIAGPCQYFLNGEFVLQTKVPPDEMNRMLAEQGSPLLSTQESNSYSVKVLENGRRLYFRNKRVIPRTEVPKSQLEFLDNWTPPKEGDPRLKPSKRPKNLDEDLDDEDEILDEPPAVKVSNSTPLPALPLSSKRVRADDDMPPMPADFLAQEPAKANEPSHKETARINKHTPVSDPPKPPQVQIEQDKETPTPPPTEPVNAAPAARKMFSQPEIVGLFREALVEVLLERYADKVTAGEVLQKLQERAES